MQMRGVFSVVWIAAVSVVSIVSVVAGSTESGRGEEVYAPGSEAEDYRRKSVDSIVDYAYFSNLRSLAPEGVLRLMAVDKAKYSSERAVRGHFQEVMKAELAPIWAVGKRQVAEVIDKDRVVLQRRLEIGLDGVNEYVEIFENFAKLVRGDFFKNLPESIQNNFSEFFQIYPLSPGATLPNLSADADAEGAWTSEEEILGRKVVYRWREGGEGEVEEKAARLGYRQKQLGRWNFVLREKIADFVPRTEETDDEEGKSMI